MSQITVPNTLQNGQDIDAPTLMENFTTIYAAFNSAIDNTNIGSAGIFASQIIPTNGTNATFGGTVGYTFTKELVLQSGAEASSLLSGAVAAGATPNAYGYAPPVFTIAGAPTEVTEHIVRGQVVVTITAGSLSFTVGVSLSGAAEFSSATSYQCFADLASLPNVGFTTAPIVSAQAASGGLFYITVTGPNNATSNGTATVNFWAIGD